jgi:hypothetical protein
MSELILLALVFVSLFYLCGVKAFYDYNKRWPTITELVKCL